MHSVHRFAALICMLGVTLGPGGCVSPLSLPITSRFHPADNPGLQAIGSNERYFAPIVQVAFSPGGEHLLTGSTHRQGYYDNSRGCCAFRLPAEFSMWARTRTDSPNQFTHNPFNILAQNPDAGEVRFSPDGTSFVLATGDQVQVRSTADGTLKTKIDALDDGQRTIQAIAPDLGTIAWTSERDQIVVQNLKTGEKLMTLESGYVVRFSPDGRYLLTVSRSKDLAISDDKLAVWDLSTRTRALEVDAHEVMSWCPPAFSPDSRYVVHCESQNRGNDDSMETQHRIKVHERATGYCVGNLRLADGVAWSLAFSPDGKQLCAGLERKDGNAEIQIWDTSKWRETHRHIFPNEHDVPYSYRKKWGITAVAFSQDGNTIAAGRSDGKVECFAIPRGVDYDFSLEQ